MLILQHLPLALVALFALGGLLGWWRGIGFAHGAGRAVAATTLVVGLVGGSFVGPAAANLWISHKAGSRNSCGSWVEAADRCALRAGHPDFRDISAGACAAWSPRREYIEGPQKRCAAAAFAAHPCDSDAGASAAHDAAAACAAPAAPVRAIVADREVARSVGAALGMLAAILVDVAVFGSFFRRG